MENQVSPVADPLPIPQAEAAGKNLVQVVSTISAVAFGTFVLGAFFNAAWPAAVASCGISLMGAVVAYFMLKQRSSS